MLEWCFTNCLRDTAAGRGVEPRSRPEGQAVAGTLIVQNQTVGEIYVSFRTLKGALYLYIAFLLCYLMSVSSWSA